MKFFYRENGDAFEVWREGRTDLLMVMNLDEFESFTQLLLRPFEIPMEYVPDVTETVQ